MFMNSSMIELRLHINWEYNVLIFPMLLLRLGTLSFENCFEIMEQKA